MLVRRDRAMVAVLIMLDVGFHAGRSCTVSAAEIAERAGLARRGIEPLLQALSRSGLLESVRGPRGGYRLGRPRRDIQMCDVVRTATADDSLAEDGPRGDLQDAVVDKLWHELDASLCERLQLTTLDDLLRRAEAAGPAPPVGGTDHLLYMIGKPRSQAVVEDDTPIPFVEFRPAWPGTGRGGAGRDLP